ncbi:MAG: bifunctional diaminohydroxyphosphoribosylaminopyrimidine deaminase/5-amino-6-(5-phosphoribosylamino)uracil reductase RibD [Candidatus Poribacteria bacterium]|nr:bifunctional diaminohydroxyphosphoribosylaminopyrimidine deaminase/5-amino-6-(5-phosphoribosylamino)uracil reductase RibD [Candidatus Poribacteria bacterium]MDE0504836.1 bifunctional diaminohydroxyphosphoribosylaminopyrimidine deaminase/5-amino-6-(5-phosphoribosylamino)uracil reductase RibD [Candidatus Poribacteria bacterium]
MADASAWTAQDAEYMRRALALAARARGRTSPNPLVGAVVVKEGEVVGEGYHQSAGGAHAEVHAINQAGTAARGGTLYVTLEPCVHYGRTPPCTEAIIRSEIAQTFVAHVDPNPKVGGKGIQELEKAGIRVHVGLCEPEARRQNEVFIKYIRTNRPFVILKSAMSLDGKIATVTGESQWISSEASRSRGHEIRDSVDAILVGVNTVLNDNPSLTTRLPGRNGKDPARIIVDSECWTPLTARVLNRDTDGYAIIATTKRASKERITSLEAAGAKVLVVEEEDDRVCLSSLMQALGCDGITSVLIEGGAKVNASALNAGIVDKIMFFIAPKIIGGTDTPNPIGGVGIQRLAEAHDLRDVSVESIDGDILVEGYLVTEC